MPPSEVIAFNASEDPRLISERRLVTTKQTATDRRGRFHPGDTFEKKDDPGMPYQSKTDYYLSVSVASVGRTYLVPCERPKLPRRSCGLTDGSGHEHNKDDDDHHSRTSMAPGGVIKNLDEWFHMLESV